MVLFWNGKYSDRYINLNTIKINTSKYLNLTLLFNIMLNLMNVDVPDELTNNEICLICHDPLEGNHTYALPECKHRYHTECIVTWFRLENQSNCPYCGNKGINNTTVAKAHSGQLGGYRRSRWWKNNIESSYQSIIAYSRRKDAPKYLVDKVNKLRELEKVEKEHKDALKNQTIEVSIKEGGEIYNKWRSKRFKIEGQIRQLKSEISKIPIVPIIIPRVVNMS